MKLFETSSSKRKKRLIQLMVPKLILDEKADLIHAFIDPFFNNSPKNSEENFEEFTAFLPKNLIQAQNEQDFQVPETTCEILSHGGKNVCIAEEWRGGPSLLEPFCFQPIMLDFTRYYVVPLFKNKIFIQRKYVGEGLSAQQIADEIECSKMAVLDALTKFGISIREPHQHHGHPSQPRYGKKYQKKLLIAHKIEQRIINVVRQLRGKGLTLRQIAQVLSEMHVGTKCRGKAWHPEMVKRILEGINFQPN